MYDDTSVLVGGAPYIRNHTLVASTFLTITAVLSLVGTLGNICVVGAVLVNSNLRNARNIFVLNLAIADLCVTTILDPFSIVGMVMGKSFFDHRPALCNFIATFCITACSTALLTIGGIGFNQYFSICLNQDYAHIFTLRKNIVMCGLFWLVGVLESLPTLLGWTRNTYDLKMLECIWDRKRSLSFTLFFSLVIIAAPAGIIAFSYARIFLYVRSSKMRLAKIAVHGSHKIKTERCKINKLVRGFFIVFVAYVICWLPYAIIILVDFDDQFPHEVHLYILLLAHTHSSLNFFIYYISNKHIKEGYRQLFLCILRPPIQPTMPAPSSVMDLSKNCPAQNAPVAVVKRTCECSEENTITQGESVVQITKL